MEVLLGNTCNYRWECWDMRTSVRFAARKLCKRVCCKLQERLRQCSFIHDQTKKQTQRRTQEQDNK